MTDSGKVVIVTGASRGIGAAAAELLAARGFRVLVNHATDDGAARRVVEAVQGKGGTARAFRADVSQEGEVTSMFDAARELGDLYGLVNNAGITGGFSRFEDVSARAAERVLAVNVLGPLLCAREAVRRLSTRRGGHGGAIVNVGSIAARIGGANEWIPYAASKGALHTMTLGLAREVAADGIRVNCVAPGLIETEIHAAGGQPDRLERLRSAVPLQRPGAAAEVATAIAWLLSDESSYVTAAILEVGGGR